MRERIKSWLGIGHNENIETATLLYEHPRFPHRIVIALGLGALIVSAIQGNGIGALSGLFIVLLGLDERNTVRAIHELGISKKFYAKAYDVSTKEIDIELGRVKKWRKKRRWLW